MRHADFSLICVATHIGAISIFRRWICLRFSQVHVHCKISLDVGTLHSATGASYLALAQNLTTVCTKKCRCSTTETDPCSSSGPVVLSVCTVSSSGARAMRVSSAVDLLRNTVELELIQTQMTQKPMLRAEVYARALRASQNRKEDSV